MTPTPHARSVKNDLCTGEVLDEGALVLRWAPRGRDEVLFAHPARPVQSGKPPHAGIPVCWPWFGPAPVEGAPNHGFARSAVWEHLTTRDDETGATTVSYGLAPDRASHPSWPHDYGLELTVTLGTVLEVSLTTTNRGPDDLTITEALHTYLAVGDVREVSIHGLDGAPFHDKTTDEERIQEGDLVLTGETDRVYRSTAEVVVDDPVLGRRLRVGTDGAANRVVWNPWDAEAAKVADIGDAWPRFVAVEAANALDDVVTVPAGSTHTLTYRLTVEDL